jgi:phosphoglucosamine mutase
LLGGEGSGHLLALDKHSTGDGIVSALQVLQTVQRSGRALSSLLGDVQLYPQTMINVRLAEGSDWKRNAHLARQIEAIQAELGRGGRVLIRPSGTEPVLRVMVEARDAETSRRMAERLAEAARNGS